MERQKQKRSMLALLLALCVVAVFSLSTLFVITHADHACTGADCRICHEIEACLTTVRHLSESAGSGAAPALGALLFLLCLILTGMAQEGRRPDTLVALNVRLDN